MNSRHRLVVGTAGFGARYGVRSATQPDPSLAKGVLRAAIAAGVHRFDTAPAYGDAEALLGVALGDAGEIWTKVSTKDSAQGVLASVARSATACRRPRLDLVQWHNWTASLLRAPTFRDSYRSLSESPTVVSLGVSTYGAEDALAAINSGLFSVVQVEWNLLNQVVVRRVAAEARARGVRIAARSVLLQGVLADGDSPLPERLRELEPFRAEATAVARQAGLSLEHLALRAALDTQSIDFVLVGVKSATELMKAVAVADDQPLDADALAACVRLDSAGSKWVDPRSWP